MTVLVSGTALAGEVVYQDDEKHDLNTTDMHPYVHRSCIYLLRCLRL